MNIQIHTYSYIYTHIMIHTYTHTHIHIIYITTDKKHKYKNENHKTFRRKDRDKFSQFLNLTIDFFSIWHQKHDQQKKKLMEFNQN